MDYLSLSLRHHNQYEPTIFKRDSGHIQTYAFFKYLQIIKYNLKCVLLHTKKKVYNSEQCLF